MEIKNIVSNLYISLPFTEKIYESNIFEVTFLFRHEMNSELTRLIKMIIVSVSRYQVQHRQT